MRWLIALMVVACGDGGAMEAPDAAVPPPMPVFSQTGYLKSTQTIHDAHFGRSVLSGSGDTLVAAQHGTVTVFVRDPIWRVAGEITLPTTSPVFGSAIAISSDGSTIAIGAPDDHTTNSGPVDSVYLFRRGATGWDPETRVDGTGAIYDEFATWLALSSDGNTLVVGSGNQSPQVASMRTYERGQGSWSLVASLGGTSDGLQFSGALALASDGSVLVARVFHDGASDYSVDVFARSGNTWVPRGSLASSDQSPRAEFGASISCSARCETIAVGAPEPPGPVSSPALEGKGAAYVFTGDGTAWTQTAKIEAMNGDIGDRFGVALAVSGDGSTIVVGARAEASASTGIDGDGASNAAPYAGAAYAFRRHLGAWTQVLYLKASNAETIDLFGAKVAVADDGTTIAVTAPYENSAATGVGGDQADNSQPYAGAVYTFEGTY